MIPVSGHIERMRDVTYFFGAVIRRGAKRLQGARATRLEFTESYVSDGDELHTIQRDAGTGTIVSDAPVATTEATQHS